MAIVAEVGSSTANSYVTEAEANAYIAGRPFTSGWLGAASHEPQLIYATRMLDNWFNWDGVKDNATPDQALEWPRDLIVTYRNRDESGLLGYDAERMYGTGRYDPNDFASVIPDDIKSAQVELALYLVQNTEFFDQGNVDSVDIGDLKVKLDTNKVRLFQPQVLAYTEKFGAPKYNLSGNIGVARLVRT